MSDAEVSALFSHTPPAALEHLSLKGNKLCDRAAALLAAARLPCLRAVSLAANQLTARGAAALGASPWAPGLEELSLGGNPLIQDEGVAALARAPLRTLRALRLCHAGITDAALTSLSAAPWITKLEDLEIGFNRALGRDAAPWAALGGAPLHALRRLDLCRVPLLCQAAAAELARAAWLPGLQVMSIAGVTLGTLAALRSSPGFGRLEARGGVRLL